MARANSYWNLTTKKDSSYLSTSATERSSRYYYLVHLLMALERRRGPSSALYLSARGQYEQEEGKIGDRSFIGLDHQRYESCKSLRHHCTILLRSRKICRRKLGANEIREILLRGPPIAFAFR